MKKEEACPRCGGTGKIDHDVGPASTQWYQERCFCPEGQKHDRSDLKSSGNPSWK